MASGGRPSTLAWAWALAACLHLSGVSAQMGVSIFAEPSCAGLASADQRVCCPSTCGECGGLQCASMPGGARECCVEQLLATSQQCGPLDTGPCILPVPIPPGKQRCNQATPDDLPYADCKDGCGSDGEEGGAAGASCDMCKCKTCAACRAPPPPPPPLPPPEYVRRLPMDAPDSYGCAFQVTLEKVWARGFTVEMRLNSWPVGQQVLVDYGVVPVQIIRAWGASSRPLPGTNAVLFTLGIDTDEQGGFGFNALTRDGMAGPMPT
eukprot:scaffold359_cov103-Isochrysis_galbana.AAC.2